MSNPLNHMEIPNEKGASTYVDLAPPCIKIISLDNSFITISHEIPLCALKKKMNFQNFLIN